MPSLGNCMYMLRLMGSVYCTPCEWATIHAVSFKLLNLNGDRLCQNKKYAIGPHKCPRKTITKYNWQPEHTQCRGQYSTGDGGLAQTSVENLWHKLNLWQGFLQLQHFFSKGYSTANAAMLRYLIL